MLSLSKIFFSSGIFDICVDSFLSPIFSAYLESLEDVTSRVSGASVSSKNCVFIYFYFFIFWWSIKYLQQNIIQSETVIGDKKLSVELYVSQAAFSFLWKFFLHFQPFCSNYSKLLEKKIKIRQDQIL